MQKRIVSIQDISCFGKCSTTVALPIISAMGIETAILPTALLSTHTGGKFENYTFLDLTGEMIDIINHWKSLALKFDGIYSGYLGSSRQIDIVSSFYDKFGKSAIKLVDPVMGDNGKLYAGFDSQFAEEMKKLCAAADIIVPNLTEACLLLGEKYTEQYDEKYVRDILKKLCDLGCSKVILTGVQPSSNKIGSCCYDSAANEYSQYFTDYRPYTFHGTGDCFASSLFGAITLGLPLKDAIKIATEFVGEAIDRTIDDIENHWYSVKFEEALPQLINNLNG